MADNCSLGTPGLASANQEIRAARARHAEASAARRAARQQLSRLDQLLAAVEELQLKGHTRVPESFDERLRELREVLPDGWRSRITPGIATTRLLDQLFVLQGPLLDRGRVGARGRPQVGSGRPLGWRCRRLSSVGGA